MRDAGTAEVDERSAERRRATVIAYGRAMRRMQQDRTAGGRDDLAAGVAYVCGVGPVPVPVLIAAADLDDARVDHRERPDDPGAADAHAAATAALAAAIAAARATGPGAGGSRPA